MNKPQLYIYILYTYIKTKLNWHNKYSTSDSMVKYNKTPITLQETNITLENRPPQKEISIYIPPGKLT